MTCFPNSITIPTSTLGFVQFLVFTHVVGIKWVSYFSCGFLTLLVRFISHFRFPLCEMPPFLLWCFCLNYWHPLYILDLNPLQLHVLIFFFFNANGFPAGSDGKESACNAGRRPGFDPWVRKLPWRRKWQPTPVLLPGESHGQRSLAGYSPWGHKESDTTERLTHTRTMLGKTARCWG